MSTQSPDDEDVDPTYLAIFSQHLTDFRAHLVGRPDGDDPSYASFYAPNACWSAAEKDAFFRGLAVHSRLRPDLIAAEVKTKTVPDVCSYIALLEQADQEASKGGRDVHARLMRKYHLPAAEVSDEWLAHEERMAERLIQFEHSHALDTLLRKREEETNARRKATKARKGGARTASNERDREGERVRREEFDKWLTQKEADWEGQDLLASLDKVGLAALDRMLRDDEEGRAFRLDAHVNPSESNTVLDAMDVDDLGAPTPGISEELIDPALLDLSRPSSSLQPTSSSSSPTTHSVPLAEPFQPRTPPFATSPLPEGPGQSSSPSVAPSLTTHGGSTIGSEDISQMSPTSRRRHQKRLYMRRKRAQNTGAAVDENAERLKPGRKPRMQPPRPNARPTTPVARPGSAGATEQMNVEDGTSLGDAARSGTGVSGDKSTYRHHKPSGKTLPYKRQLDFISNGVDVQRLREEGLDLFHLQALSKLMHTYNELHDVSSSVGSAISAETLSLLRGLVVQFVSRVMSIAIVVREQERIAKLQTKAWRLTENQVISTSNVKSALTLYGADSLSTRSHFNGLLRKLDLEEDGDADVNEQANGNDARDNHDMDDHAAPDVAAHTDGNCVKDETADISFQPLSCLRTIFPPFINPPSSGLHVGDSSGSIDPSTYMPWPSSILLSSAAEPKEDGDEDEDEDEDDPDLLSDESDREELARELHHENALDHEDRLYDAEVERALWKRSGMLPSAAANLAAAQPAHDDASHARAPDQSPPRKRQRKTRGDEPVARELRHGGVTADERDVEAELFDDAGADEDEDYDDGEDEVEMVEKDASAASSAGKKRKMGSARVSQQSLWYRKPNPHGRIKSAVYVLDSDEE
ncbi:hypothetical protein C8Q80DRAFT_1266377 [Daedaleopsis nitida]|nr:hypothetical protein C8Q80DRAFT_1266377 [Daedaleopsis nitida]